jgi:flagellar protein FlaG
MNAIITDSSVNVSGNPLTSRNEKGVDMEVQPSEYTQTKQQVTVEGSNTEKKEQEGSKYTEKEVYDAIESANKKVEHTKTEFEFSIHEDTKRIMVKVMDKDTHEVIKELPPEKILDAVACVWEMAGLLVDEKV